MTAQQILTLVLSGFAGAALFFLVFAAALNGTWELFALSTLGYSVVAALAVGLGRARPLWVAIALACPALPWMALLFVGAIKESGWLQASAWPAAVVFLFLLAWLVGALSARFAPK